MLGSAKSEHPRLTKCEIMLEDFHPMLCDHDTSTSRTDGQMDRPTTLL